MSQPEKEVPERRLVVYQLIELSRRSKNNPEGYATEYVILGPEGVDLSDLEVAYRATTPKRPDAASFLKWLVATHDFKSVNWGGTFQWRSRWCRTPQGYRDETGAFVSYQEHRVEPQS